MPRTSPYQIELTKDERNRLESTPRRYTPAYREVTRAKIVLLAAEGMPNDEIAPPGWAPPAKSSPSGVSGSTSNGWPGSRSEYEPGGLRSSPPEVVVAIKALACELPAANGGAPLARWHAPELARAAIEQGIVASISDTTIWRWLSADAIRPWQYRSWIFPRDPDFAKKAGRVLDLYHRRFLDGEPLGQRDFVVCADEKTSIQARARKHTTAPPTPRGGAMRVEHEYERGGALAYLAGWDVHRAKLFGGCEPSTGIEPFGRLVEQVMGAEPSASAERVFRIVDNGSSHRGRASMDRVQGAWSNLVLVHLPVHASWLNQIEIYFSIVQRKVLTPNDFTDLVEVEARLLDFQNHYEKIAQPFEWKFTRADLDAVLTKIQGQHPSTAEAA